MTNQWPSGPHQPQLAPGAVHVWRSTLDRSPERLAFYESLLAIDERERAGRFYFERDRNHYIVGRGILRDLLGRYLDQPPQEVEISYSEYDKPTLPSNELQFNLAHSGGYALYAFTLEEAVGIDIEEERPLPDALDIAERFFSRGEWKTLAALPVAEQSSAFYRCWTRKEAFIKAVGEGLSYPLDAFDVTLAPGEPARLLSIRGDVDAERRWTLLALDSPRGFQGALAVRRSRDIELEQFFYTYPAG